MLANLANVFILSQKSLDFAPDFALSFFYYKQRSSLTL